MRPPALLSRIDRTITALSGIDVRMIEPGRSNLAVAAPGAREPDDVAVTMQALRGLKVEGICTISTTLRLPSPSSL